MYDFDDLIFEDRNREYGAYQLRKKYNASVIIGLLISVSFACLITIVPFLIERSNEKTVYGGNKYIQVSMTLLEPPKEEYIIPPVPAPPESHKAPEIIKYVAPEIVDTLTPNQMTQISNEEMLSSITDTIPSETGKSSGIDLFADFGTGTDDALIFVESMPTFLGGGINKFQEWVKKRTNYPQEAIENKISGIVIISFVIERDGSVSNVTVLKGVNPILDNEAVKVISECPKWSPGKLRGQPVRIRCVFPINFAPLGR